MYKTYITNKAYASKNKCQKSICIQKCIGNKNTYASKNMLKKHMHKKKNTSKNKCQKSIRIKNMVKKPKIMLTVKS